MIIFIKNKIFIKINYINKNTICNCPTKFNFFLLFSLFKIVNLCKKSFDGFDK